MKRGRLNKYGKGPINVRGTLDKFSFHKHNGSRTALVANLYHAEDNRFLCRHAWVPAKRFYRCEPGDRVRFRATIKRWKDGFYLVEPCRVRIIQKTNQKLAQNRLASWLESGILEVEV